MAYNLVRTMSLWRAKRKYEANQSLNERADDTLLAITLLRNQSENHDVYSTDEIEQSLVDGLDILVKIRDSVEEPSQASNYFVALGDHLRRNGRKQTSKQFKTELDTTISVLNTAIDEMEWQKDLEYVERLFRRIEEFSSETSKRSADDMREHLAGRTS